MKKNILVLMLVFSLLGKVAFCEEAGTNANKLPSISRGEIENLIHKVRKVTLKDKVFDYHRLRKKFIWEEGIECDLTTTESISISISILNAHEVFNPELMAHGGAGDKWEALLKKESAKGDAAAASVLEKAKSYEDQTKERYRVFCSVSALDPKEITQLVNKELGFLVLVCTQNHTKEEKDYKAMDEWDRRFEEIDHQELNKKYPHMSQSADRIIDFFIEKKLPEIEKYLEEHPEILIESLKKNGLSYDHLLNLKDKKLRTKFRSAIVQNAAHATLKEKVCLYFKIYSFWIYVLSGMIAAFLVYLFVRKKWA